MEVFIARDGVTIGEFPHQNLEELARAGTVQPTDHYWHYGMTDWLPLSDFLEGEAWQQEAPPKPPAQKVPLAVIAKRFLLVAGIAALFVLAGGLLIYLTHSSGDEGELPTKPMEGASGQAEPPSELEVRDEAVADLRQRIENLPARAVPPLHIFYYDVRVQMNKTLTPRAPWMATIEGVENAVEPGTENTLRRTRFLLLAEYEEGEWKFNGYQGQATNMIDFSTAETIERADSATPPSLVYLLGLKTRQ